MSTTKRPVSDIINYTEEIRKITSSLTDERDMLRDALVKITQVNCAVGSNIAEIIRDIRKIARDAVPDYALRAKGIVIDD